MCYKLSEKPCYDTEHCKDTHRETHPEGNFLNILVFLRQLPEEHRLAYFYKRSERQNRCYKRDYRRKQEAYVSALDRLLVCRLIDHPFGGKAVERRYTADRKSAYQEQDCRVRHPLGKPAELVQVRGPRLLEHRACCKEEEAFEQSVVHCVIKARRNSESRAEAAGCQYITDLGDRVESEKPFEIVLGKGHRDTDEHTYGTYKYKEELHLAKCHALEQEICESYYAVDTGFRQDAGYKYGYRSRCRAVGVRCQRVEGDDEGFCGKAYIEQRKGNNR